MKYLELLGKRNLVRVFAFLFVELIEIMEGRVLNLPSVQQKLLSLCCRVDLIHVTGSPITCESMLSLDQFRLLVYSTSLASGSQSIFGSVYSFPFG